MPNRESLSVPIQNHAEAQVIFGQADVFLKIVEDSFNAKVVVKSDGLKIIGEDSKDVHRVGKTFESLLNLVRSGQHIDATDVKHAVRASKSEKTQSVGKHGRHSNSGIFQTWTCTSEDPWTEPVCGIN